MKMAIISCSAVEVLPSWRLTASSGSGLLVLGHLAPAFAEQVAGRTEPERQRSRSTKNTSSQCQESLMPKSGTLTGLLERLFLTLSFLFLLMPLKSLFSFIFLIYFFCSSTVLPIPAPAFPAPPTPSFHGQSPPCCPRLWVIYSCSWTTPDATKRFLIWIFSLSKLGAE